MRLQLDTAVTGTGATRPGEVTQPVPVGGTGADSSRVGSGSSGSDTVQISGLSSALNALESGRAARVGRLAALVQNGSYDVPASQVSRAVVQDAISRST